ncbi:hypothetical protein BGZ92_008580 [Podila epicladia]|nr:hypothetical protein BGZ92_008580 [Podila epicladia]
MIVTVFPSGTISINRARVFLLSSSSSATFGILECDNRTISAVFCPDGKQQRAGAQLREFAEMYTLSKSHRPKKKGHSKRISHLDIIRMNGPCPKPIKKDIDVAIKCLSPQDRKLVCPYFFNLEFYSKTLEAEEAKGVLELHNTGCKGKDKHKCDGGGHWNDKCTSVGIYCGSQIFGCNTLDDGVYQCDSIGGKPKLVEICTVGGCVNRGSYAPSSCKDTECTCSKSGEVCGSSFSPTCGWKKSSLYFCKTEGEKPVRVKTCESGNCDPSTNKCTSYPDTDCLCKSLGPVCGTDFDPKKCQLEDATLYECQVLGQLPIEKIKCDYGYCNREERQCNVTPLKDECLCKQPDQICSVDFPDSCKYRAGTLYLCQGPKQPPKQIEWCENNLCPSGRGACGGDPIVDCLCKQKGKRKLHHTPALLEIGPLIKRPAPMAARKRPTTAKQIATLACAAKRVVLSVVMSSIPSADLTAEQSMNARLLVLLRPSTRGATLSSATATKQTACLLFSRGASANSPARSAVTVFQAAAGSEMAFNSSAMGLGMSPDQLSGARTAVMPRTEPVQAVAEKTASAPPKAKYSSLCSYPFCPICGSSFDPKTCNFNPGSLYSCPGAGWPPKLIKWCPGGVCPPGANDCTYPPVDDCRCKSAQNVVCGSTFDSKCDLVPSALYQCVGEGFKPAKIINCESRMCAPGDSKCGTSEKCLCKATGQICGSSYPAECHYKPETVYTCQSAGVIPTKTAKCHKGCDKGTGTCNPDHCGCKKVGDVCGSAFDPTCYLDSNTLYSCRAINGKPTFAEKCTSGNCDKDTNTCAPADCECKEEGEICGATFPKDCAYEPGTLYRCKHGKRGKVEQVCKSKKCKPDESHCAPAKCECPAIGDFCSADFEGCHLKPNALYTCKEVAGKPVLKEKCKSGSCPAGGRTCGVGKCECPRAGNICGATFPYECRLTPTALYTCCDAGAKPERSKDCPSMSCPKDTDKCGPDPCTCTDDKYVCPSDFPTSCGLKENTLYSCKVNEKPKEFVRCKEGSCHKDCHTCIPVQPEICYCTTPGDICGSTFPMRCGLYKDSLYTCGEDLIPKLVAKCPSGSCPSGETDCTNVDECNCKDEHKGKICGSSFADQCGYNKGAVYTCKETGKPPVDEKQCPYNYCSAGSKDCSTIDKCACTKTGQICGSTFPADCDYKENSLYFCADEGDKPKEFDDCNGRGCPASTHACNPDPCLCTISGQICGATFPKKCRLEEAALYFCPAKEQKPKFIQNCPSNSCPADATQCDRGGIDCDCKRAGQPCGKSFPPGCYYEPDVKYHCGQAGDTPKMLTRYPQGKCKDGDKDYTDRDPCACPDNGLTCGSVLKNFYDCTKLPLKDDAIYRCKAEEYPVLVEECPAPEHCVPLSPEPECRNDPCSCSKEGSTVCGGSINSKCGLKVGVQYVCRNGAFVRSEVCNYKCNKLAGQCVDKCACINDGVVCGSQIPNCGYKNSTLYACIENAQPREIRPCDPTICKVGPLVVIENSPIWMTDTTAPSGSSPILFSPNNFTASLPELGMIISGPGDRGKYFPHTGLEYNDTCAPNPCYCRPGETLRCSKTFDSTCGFDPTLLLSCPSNGGPPVVVDYCESSKNCEETAEITRCITNPCDCKNEKGTVCSADFPWTCKYPDNAVYSCQAIGDRPKLLEPCAPDSCRTQDDGGRCAKNPCSCDTDQFCSDAFGSDCGLELNTIVECEKSGHKPVEVKKCKDGLVCNIENGAPTCHSDECHCSKYSAGATTCGFSLDSKCIIDENTIYKCPSPDGGEWEPSKDCGKDKCILTYETTERGMGAVAKCQPEICLCDAGNDGRTLCGSNFDPKCDLQKDSSYFCKAGQPPNLLRDCRPGTCFYDSNRGSAKCHDALCKCPLGNLTVCGSFFPPRCRFEKSNIYECKGTLGSDPVFQGDCKPESCEMKDGQGKCREELCNCNEGDETICGHDFDYSCGYPSETIMKCYGRNKVPVLGGSCLPGTCFMKDGNSKCITPDKCLCDRGSPRDVCGGIAFPGCPGIDKNTVYHCDGTDYSKPEEKQKCEDTEVCGVNEKYGQGCIPIIPLDKCVCTGMKKKMCGSEFPKECSRPENNLYNCDDPKNPYLESQCDGTTCDPKLGAHCVPIVKQCKCSSGATKACGSQLDAYCNATADTLFDCVDGKPTVKTNCDPYKCVVVPDPHCDKPPDPDCKCKANQTRVCGKSFPDKCKFADDDLFSCYGPSSTVTRVQSCPIDECIVNDGNDMCIDHTCDCKIAGTSHCGSKFPYHCQYEDDFVYTCTERNKPPVKAQYPCSAGCEQVTLQQAKCRVDPCDCTAEQTVATQCGSAFPIGCNRTANSLFKCDNANHPPVPIMDCKPLTCETVNSIGGCKPNPCLCSENQVGKDICESAFPSDCRYPKDTLLHCYKALEEPGKGINCYPETCEQGPDGQGQCTAPNPCECSASQVGKNLCGSQFLSNCSYPDDSLYKCDKDSELPIPGKPCDPQICEVDKSGIGSCVDDCRCTTLQSGKKLCGSQFPASCKLFPDTLYYCSMPGYKPSESKDCLPQECIAGTERASETGSCAPDPCLCTKEEVGEKRCGSQFPYKCGYYINTLFTCEREGDKPEPLTDCLPRTCDVLQGEGKCRVDPCLCTHEQTKAPLCGSAFPDGCPVKKNTLYTCANVNDKPMESRDCSPQDCQMVGSVGSCTPDPCGCPKAQVGKTLCSTQFPDSCVLPKNTLLTCTKEGERPTPGTSCLPRKCVVIDDTGSCEPDPCLCTAAQLGKNYCDSQFPTCGLVQDTLYTCKTKGVKPQPKKDCLPQKCELQDDDTGACAPDPCACSADQVGKTLCGSQFPTVCFPTNTQYTCTKAGDKPSSPKDCKPQTCNVVGDSGSCAPDPCLCTTAQLGRKYCGSQFPLCELAMHTQYTCETAGVKPSATKDCKPQTCDVVGDSGACAPDPCVCTIAQVGKSYCGSQFPTCPVVKDTLYTCETAGLKPKVKNDCRPQTCDVASGTGACAPDPCVCTTAQVGKDFCGSQFPTCPVVKDILYTCETARLKPKEKTDCRPQTCDVAKDTGSCAPDPCLCTVEQTGKTLCGSQFPGCNIPSDTLVACNKAGVKPTTGTDCSPQTCAVTNGVGACTKDPCACIDEVATKCGSSFPEGCWAKDTVFTCTGQKDKIPNPVEPCDPFKCLQKTGSAECAKDPCLCEKEGIVCGSAFPGCPGINEHYLYSCSTNKAPKEIAKCAIDGCDPKTLTCEPPECTCKATGQFCGSTLGGTKCGFINEATYTCSGVGEIPRHKENCPKTCLTATGTCAVDPCICTKNGLICGSALPKDCRLNSDILYECRIGRLPAEKETCIKDGCIAGTTACTVDPCKCTADQGTCSKDYPPTCTGFVENTVYDCSGPGKIPQRAKTCADDEICSVKNKVASCVPDCTCKDKNDKCGIDISWKCGLKNDTLYSCSTIGADYAEKQTCLAGACKTGTKECAVDPCACTKIGAICGKDFPAACTALGKDTVYTCNAVGHPAIEGKVCKVGLCANGDCPAEPISCVCKADGPWCGNEIIKDCPDVDPDLYYSCLKGTKPFPFERCSGGKPTNGNCLCKDTNTICSSYFPFECGYRQDMIQKCTGGRGTRPIKDQQCAIGRCTPQRTCDKTCTCTNKDPLCGAALPDTCKVNKGSTYRCDYAGATPTGEIACDIPCNPQYGPDRCGQAF